jgi:hypothetical protein
VQRLWRVAEAVQQKYGAAGGCVARQGPGAGDDPVRPNRQPLADSCRERARRPAPPPEKYTERDRDRDQ